MSNAVNRSMPSATVIPVLSYPDVKSAVVWLCQVFGFVERLRIGDHRSQLLFGDGAVVVTGGSGDGLDGGGHSVMLRVPDAQAHYEKAKRHGAQTSGPPTDHPYGERQYSAVDIGGHFWTFTETIGDVDPADWGGDLIEDAV